MIWYEAPKWFHWVGSGYGLEGVEEVLQMKKKIGMDFMSIYVPAIHTNWFELNLFTCNHMFIHLKIVPD